MSNAMKIDELQVVGETRKWRFVVARSAGVWIGGAVAKTPDGMSGEFMEVLPRVGRNFQLGVAERAEAVRITSAIAAGSTDRYGEVTAWNVSPEERGDPEEIRCDVCGDLECDGDGCFSGGEVDDA